MLTFQVQEKKVKKIADMNMDVSKAVGNGNVASSSNQKSSHGVNGEYTDKSFTSLTLTKDLGIQSLRLPVVVVPNSCFICIYV